MGSSKANIGTAIRSLLAAAAIGTILGVAGASLAPNVPTATWLLWCAATLCGLAAVLVAAVVLGLHLRQFVLRKGGTDTQWLAFSAEPDGLVALRKPVRTAQLREAGQSGHETRHAR